MARFNDFLPGFWGNAGYGNTGYGSNSGLGYSSGLSTGNYPSILDVFGNLMGSWPFSNAAGGQVTSGQNIDYMPAMDVRETDNALEVDTELPGVNEKNIDISLNNGVLTISGEKKSECQTKGKSCQRGERMYGYFSRSVALPDGLDVDQAHASFVNGVVKVTIPKNANFNQQIRHIPIRGQQGQQSAQQQGQQVPIQNQNQPGQQGNKHS